MSVGIVTEENIKNGRPIVEGTKIGVLQIKQIVVDGGVSTDVLVDEYPNLTEEGIQSALEYVEQNQDEIAELERESERAKSEAEDVGVLYDEHGRVESVEARDGGDRR
jgi:uncharacterized protein (DUF433 family)